MENKSDKWRLNIGCHRHTLMSRDSEAQYLTTLEECRKEVRSAEETWRSLGYVVWFAEAVPPGGGDPVKLHPGTPCRY